MLNVQMGICKLDFQLDVELDMSELDLRVWYVTAMVLFALRSKQRNRRTRIRKHDDWILSEIAKNLPYFCKTQMLYHVICDVGQPAEPCSHIVKD